MYNRNVNEDRLELRLFVFFLHQIRDGFPLHNNKVVHVIETLQQWKSSVCLQKMVVLIPCNQSVFATAGVRSNERHLRRQQMIVPRICVSSKAWVG